MTDSLQKALEGKPIEVRVAKYNRIYEYFVDFFGIFLPGITFFAIFFLIVFGFFFVVCKGWLNINFDALGLLAKYQMEFAAVSLILSYVMGFVFFRKGPKKADVASVMSIWRDIINDEPPVDIKDIFVKTDNCSQKDKEVCTDMKRIIRNRGKVRKELSSVVHWPYDNLHGYLEKRLPHLADLIPWQGNSNNGPQALQVPIPGAGHEDKGERKAGMQRSKHFMNILKENIRFYAPDNYHIVARNEAHVRLSSSLWYAVRLLAFISSFALTLSSILFFFFWYDTIFSEITYKFGVYGGFCLVVILFCWIIKREIQKFLFYQRVREIIFILNTAYQLCKSEPSFSTEFANHIPTWPKNICQAKPSYLGSLE